MAEKSLDSKVLSELLDMVGPEHQMALLEQVRADLRRCWAVFDTELERAPGDRDVPLLCKTAHEVKGVAATIGAIGLADIAKQVEHACTDRDATALTLCLPDIAQRTGLTAQSIADMAQAT
jgi:non-ribosomal peptide synthetase component F